MQAQQSLIEELEEAVQSGSRERRVDTLRRITDLFLLAPAQLSNEQIGVFDDVLTRLVARVETKARTELANRLAPIAQAPADVIKRLAYDDEIAVAGPVLTQSPRLTTEDLVSIAQQKGQAHLYAIAGRDRIEEQVTDVLVNRGNREVMHTLAANAGAAFSNTGYSRMVERAENDEGLVETLGGRVDVPREASAPRNFEDAQRLVSLLQETGRLDESEIHIFAKHEKYEEAMAGLAALCAVPVDLIERLAQSRRTDALLVPCKAAGFSWATVRALLELRARHNAVADHGMDAAMKEFAKLSQPTAARVLRFWQVRQTTAAQATD